MVIHPKVLAIPQLSVLVLGFVLLASVAGCYTSQHRPVMFRTEADVQCPDWSVPVEVDGRYYCIDRSFFDDEDDY